jgi:NAD(P)-dependent dehydrogenase (short-subunit alcohol dehydrogenase family)
MNATPSKTVLITGSNTGFGYVTARELAKQGWTVLMVCRSRERGEAACKRIQAETGVLPELYLGDLLLQRDVRRIASEVKAQHSRLDVLMNNAGFAYSERAVTDEGFERTFALNYLAYFTLTRELLPLLRSADAGRIVNTTSSAHRWPGAALDNWQGEQSFPKRVFPPLPLMYGWTNVFRILLTYELAERLAGDGIVANCVCPGFVPVERSSASRFQNKIGSLLGKLIPGVRTPEQAAETMLFLAADAQAALLNGTYHESGVLMRSSDQTYDGAMRKALWLKTEALLADGHARSATPSE